ncbi:hypothetical protein Cni_G06469 [Canna indica]|uniref:Uncharacterized protein n=1 Tax=Canna indica TaxID=4628 RepID=A0AAQ3JXB2_9LILI|nr:hypothetical protein Cni_G06469 [Canna indica]
MLNKFLKNTSKSSVCNQEKFEALSAQASESSTPIDEDEIYRQVIRPERHGRTRGYGLGTTPSSVFRATPGRIELTSQLQAANVRNEKLISKIEKLEKKMEEDKRERKEQMIEAMEEKRKKMEEDIQKKMEEKIQEEKRKMEDEKKKMEEQFQHDRRKMDMIVAFMDEMKGKNLQR